MDALIIEDVKYTYNYTFKNESPKRLPGKPLLKINGLSIISHVVKRAKETQIGEVIVATEDDEIIEDVKKNNGEAILTSKAHKSGTDRIWEAYKKIKY